MLRDPQSFAVPEDLLTNPGSLSNEPERRFFDWAFPEDDFFGKGMGRGFVNRLTKDLPYERTRAKYETEINEVLALCKGCIDVAPTGEPTGEDLTELIRAQAQELGMEAIGFTAFDRSHVFRKHRRSVRFKSIIIAGISHSHSGTNTETPSEHVHDQRIETGLDSTRRALQLASFIQSHGYRVQIIAGPIGLDLAKLIPYGVQAGLGQLGANGQLLSPHFGSNWWPIAMSTDAGVTYGQPVDYGITGLCEECQVCIRRCPGRAIPKQRVNWRGVVKHKILASRCMPMLERYEMCAICIKVCPVQRYGLEPVLQHYEETGKILGKDSDELEEFTLPDKGHFGAGSMPKFSPSESVIDYETAAEQVDAEVLFGFNE